jgi:hypothetical protein
VTSQRSSQAGESPPALPGLRKQRCGPLRESCRETHRAQQRTDSKPHRSRHRKAIRRAPAPTGRRKRTHPRADRFRAADELSRRNEPAPRRWRAAYSNLSARLRQLPQPICNPRTQIAEVPLHGLGLDQTDLSMKRTFGIGEWLWSGRRPDLSRRVVANPELTQPRVSWSFGGVP